MQIDNLSRRQFLLASTAIAATAVLPVALGSTWQYVEDSEKWFLDDPPKIIYKATETARYGYADWRYLMATGEIEALDAQNW